MDTTHRQSKRAFARTSRHLVTALLVAGVAFVCAVANAAPLVSSVTADHNNSAFVQGIDTDSYHSTTLVATNPAAEASALQCEGDYCYVDTAATATVAASFDSASTFATDLHAGGHVSYDQSPIAGSSAAASSDSTYTFTVTGTVVYRLSGFITNSNTGPTTVDSSVKLSKAGSDVFALRNNDSPSFNQNFAQAGVLTPGTYTIAATCGVYYFDTPGSGANEVKYALVLSAPVVNSTGDAADANPGDGVCETAAGNGVCTLRALLQEVAPDSTIAFDIPTSDPNYNAGTGAYTIRLTNGEIPITKGVTINGPGMNALIISGNDASRVFNISGISSPGAVNMADLTVTHGNVGSGDGGGILVASATLNLTRVAITHCTAGNGGGLAGGTMNLDTCSVLSNHSTGYLTGHGNIPERRRRCEWLRHAHQLHDWRRRPGKHFDLQRRRSEL